MIQVCSCPLSRQVFVFSHSFSYQPVLIRVRKIKAPFFVMERCTKKIFRIQIAFTNSGKHHFLSFPFPDPCTESAFLFTISYLNTKNFSCHYTCRIKRVSSSALKLRFLSPYSVKSELLVLFTGQKCMFIGFSVISSFWLFFL